MTEAQTEKDEGEVSLAVKILCRKLGLHKIRSTTTGMSRWCTREGCTYSWDYD